MTTSTKILWGGLTALCLSSALAQAVPPAPDPRRIDAPAQGDGPTGLHQTDDGRDARVGSIGQSCASGQGPSSAARCT